MSNTEDIVTEAREVLEGITHGPWMVHDDPEDDTYSVDAKSDLTVTIIADLIETEQDATFIAAAPGLVRSLLAALETAETTAQWLVAENGYEYDALLMRQGELLTAAVNALKGDPPPLTTWSHHDVAELAAGAISKRDRTIRRLLDMCVMADVIDEGYAAEIRAALGGVS